jgi:DNA topoisomerase I
MMAKVLPVDSFSPEELARLAKLQYVLDDESGFTRKTNGAGFSYVNGSGRPLRDPQQIKRIETLAIPPAWTNVWICRVPTGHLQATGRDARGRKQYIYHEHWREISNLAKFLRLAACPQFLPRLRRLVSRDLRGRELTRTRVLAGMVALLDLTSIRIGNEEYVRENGSYGLATLRTRHLTIEGGRATIRFRAKAGLRREVMVEDKRLVRLLTQIKKLRGAHVFQYVDNEGQIKVADAIAVNDYLRERTGHHFTAKDFRTWKASALATGLLYEQRSLEKVSARKRVAKSVIAAVADALGNTATISRKYYIHPGLIEAYLGGQFPQIFHRFQASRKKSLTPSEQLFARFLRHSWHRGC